VDLTIEVGGAQTITRSLAATRMDGRLALVGLLSGAPVSVNPFTSGVTISPIKVGSRQDFEEMNRAMAFHCVRPVIAQSLPFERLLDALRLLEQGRHIGKIVIGFEK
jgi:NADPH:quinone reductase-like Zn-dependent oxidoreductase